MTSFPERPAAAGGTDGDTVADLLAAGFVPVADRGDVPADGLLGVTTPGGVPVCLADVDGELHALHDVCSHQAFPLSAGELAADGTVECSWHGARFDPRSGLPCRGPACDPVRTYDVRVVEGRVYVKAPQGPGTQGPGTR